MIVSFGRVEVATDSNLVGAGIASSLETTS
jgi:hypothetical protein